MDNVRKKIKKGFEATKLFFYALISIFFHSKNVFLIKNKKGHCRTESRTATEGAGSDTGRGEGEGGEMITLIF